MNVSLFLSVLPYIVKGMIGIFAVTAVIILCIVILNKTTEFFENRKNSDNADGSKQ